MSRYKHFQVYTCPWKDRCLCKNTLHPGGDKCPGSNKCFGKDRYCAKDRCLVKHKCAGKTPQCINIFGFSWSMIGRAQQAGWLNIILLSGAQKSASVHLNIHHPTIDDAHLEVWLWLTEKNYPKDFKDILDRNGFLDFSEFFYGKIKCKYHKFSWRSRIFGFFSISSNFQTSTQWN